MKRKLIRTAMGSVMQTTDRKSTRLNSSHLVISYAVFCLKKKNTILVSVSLVCVAAWDHSPPLPRLGGERISRLLDIFAGRRQKILHSPRTIVPSSDHRSY